MKTELTREESAKLIELGVDPKLASKCDMTMKIGVGVRGIIKRPDPKPIFNLSDILAILPKNIDVGDGTKSYLTIVSPKEDVWRVSYEDKSAILDSVCLPNLIDALYHTLILRIKDGHYNPKNDKK